MGLLSEGSPLSWEETKKLADHVRKHGILQFINLYKKLKDREGDCLRWGDEVEYLLVKLNDEAKQAQLLLRGSEVLTQLRAIEAAKNGDNPTKWVPEYAEYCVEGTPGKPYGHRMAHFNMVEANMKLRREEVKKLLGQDEFPLTLTAFPRMGCPNFTHPPHKPTPETGASRSLFFPDPVICQVHPRFTTLTRNIRQRRGEKVAINIPVFKDKNTPGPYLDDFSSLGDDGEKGRQAKPDHIYLDAMGFGMGCCCLQMTFQAVNINEARDLYDQLTPLTPIIMALSAATPIYRGLLADIECRWDIISEAVDDRTQEERGLKPLKENQFRIPKSRYDSIDSYLSSKGEKYNDTELIYDREIYQQLRDAGIDHLLAQHVAHLFIRDTISVFSEKVNQNDEEDTDHFENIQSTNWQSMRFKPPPPNSPIGWRVEFRPTEVQLTDFENAAFVVFVVLLTRVMLSFRLNLLIPISKVDANMRSAMKRDAVLKEKFYFRKEIVTESSPPEAEEACSDCCQGCPAEYTQFTVDEIINGKPNEFPGLIPLIQKYMLSVDDCDVDTSCTISQYLKLISDRASGKLKTTARYIRDFVTEHPDYKQDSRVSDSINYDLVQHCVDISEGRVEVPELLPKYETKTAQAIPNAMAKEECYIHKKMKKQNGENGEEAENDCGGMNGVLGMNVKC